MRLPLLTVTLALACGPTSEETTEASTFASTTSSVTSSTADTTTTTSTDASGEPTPTEAGTTGAPTIACDPDPDPLPEDQFIATIAGAICEQKAACGCAVDFGCATPFAGQLTALQDYAHAHGFTYDGVCAARLLNARVQHPGCTLASAYYDVLCDPSDCPIYRSTAGPGDPCEYSEDSDSLYSFIRLAPPCADPLFCDDGICSEGTQFPTVADGQPCADANGPLAQCMRGSGCDYADTLTCQPLLAEGAPCPDDAQCSYELFCSADEICTAKLPAGATCTDLAECETYRCLTGQCADDTWICIVAEVDDLFFLSPDIT